MKYAAVCAALVAAGLTSCTPSKQGALLVVLKVPPGTVSTFAVVSADAKSTACFALDQPPVSVAVNQGDLASVVTISARGFVDANCTTEPAVAETASFDMARFRQGLIGRIELTLQPAVPRVETDCSNGLDDDHDGTVDCVDTDCEAKSCVGGNVCVTNQVCTAGQCSGGNSVVCNSPPSCFKAPGTCVVETGCRYLPNPGANCDDDNPCTQQEQCTVSGACVGVAITCKTPPNAQCFQSVGTCSADAGCSYAPTPGASCNDGVNCTILDTCTGDGGCAGQQVDCDHFACQVPRHQCSADGTCLFDPIDAGTPCGDGGVCNAQGSCNEPTQLVISNVTPAQLPSFPDGGTTLNCGTTIIDTGDGGTPTVNNWCLNQPLFNWASVAQPGGQVATVLAFSSLDVGASGTVNIVGQQPVIIVTQGRLTVAGTITASSGSSSCLSGGAGGNADAGNGGGGGAGFGTAGGSGGKGALGEAGGLAGLENGEVTLVPLRGGCPGGIDRGTPALGGGALQLSSLGDLTVTGIINAPGRGGTGGKLGLASGGDGAGSGGGVLLEALHLTLSGVAVVAANGGAGGEGGALLATGSTGQDGRASTTAAVCGNGSLAPKGGNGGVVSAAGDDGQFAALWAGGGGGGGVGRVRFNSVLGCSIGPSVKLSPPPTSNLTDAGCQ